MRRLIASVAVFAGERLGFGIKRRFETIRVLNGKAVLVAGLVLMAGANAAAQTYTATPLPPPPGYVFFNLDGSMNNSGQVLGEAGSPGAAVRFPVLWTNGVPQPLPMPSGSVYQ